MMDENITKERPTFVTHLECSLTGERHEADALQGLSRAGKPLLVRYDLPALGAAVTKEELAARPQDLWRYREFLPVRKVENVVSLGEPTIPPMARSPFSNTLPDFVVSGPSLAAKGYGGLLAAGSFDHAWRVAPTASFFAIDCIPRLVVRSRTGGMIKRSGAPERIISA